MTWALVHVASGAIISTTSVRSFAYVPGVEVLPAPQDVAPASHWWDGESYRLRDDAVISLPSSSAPPGATMDISCPAEAWISLTDGTITNSRRVTIEGGYRKNRLALVGKYRGEASIDVGSVPEGLEQVRQQRDLMLLASDKYALADYPIAEAARSTWLEYRQALREIPETQPQASLETVQWPVAPSSEAS